MSLTRITAPAFCGVLLMCGACRSSTPHDAGAMTDLPVWTVDSTPVFGVSGRLISWIGSCDRDSVFVWDFANQKLAVVTETDGVVREFRPFPDAPTQVPSLLACASAGTIAVLVEPEVGPEDLRAPAPGRGEKFADFKAPYYLIDRNGNLHRELGEISVGEYVITGGFFPRPLGRRTSIAMSGDWLYTGTADSAAVVGRNLADGSVRVVRLGIAARAPTDDQYEHAVDAHVMWLAERDLRAMMKRRFMRMPPPDQVPPYRALYAGGSGMIWTLVSAPGDTITRLRGVLDGRVHADLTIPMRLEVLALSDRYVAGVYEDPRAEPHLVLLRIRQST